MTQPEPDDKPRSWMPLIIAASIAILVVAGAVITHLVRADLSPEKRTAADACEAQYDKQFPDGPGISGGDIYSATEWAALDDRLVGLGIKTEQSLTGEQADTKDDEAAALVSSGGDLMTVVWQRDDESHALCEAPMQAGAVTSVTVTEIVVPSASASPSPSPS